MSINNKITYDARLGVKGECQYRFMDKCTPVEELRTILRNFGGYILACKKNNTDDYIEGVAEQLNIVSKALGEKYTYEYDFRRDEFVINGINTKENNGAYECKCCECGKVFYGFKRQVACEECKQIKRRIKK